MPDKYNPQESEQKWLQYWGQQKIFAFDPAKKGKIYSIDTPPPTVSGKMHMGHAFSYTQEDIIARYKRLRGFNVFYPFGTDDNGLPTERLVEKMKNVKGSKMPRQDFIKLCEDTLKEIKPTFVADWKHIGISCDFNLCYSTIDANCRKISQWSFLDLQKKGRVYRKEAPVLWCPLCETAIAQVELKDKEKDTRLVHIEVKTEDGQQLVFATTRPELYYSCVGMSVNPEDERYKKHIGKTVIMPLTNARIQLTTDKIVDPAFGSGVVYFCSSGDAQFLDWETRHPVKHKIYLLNKDGTLNEHAGKYQGLIVEAARKKIVEDLQALNVVKKLEPLKHVVNTHERCGTIVEYVSSKQWFIRYLDLKDDLLKWGAELQWHPEFMKLRYDNWANGLKWDWCISRQRFFGVPFPIWYCKKCETPIFADESQLPVDPLKDNPQLKACPQCNCKEFFPEKDVLDTWATSSMSPQLALELVPKKYRAKMFPFTLRPQGQDIITFWLFNTMVKSRLHFGKNPWKETIISGYVTDPQGQKMSKSKGNVVDPQELLKKYSADALRYWAGGSKLGEDISYQEKELIAGDKFVVKLWNAAHFVAMHLGNIDFKQLKQGTETIDQWILTKLSNTITEATKAFEEYEYSKAKMVIEQFFWHDFCDNYLELVKTRLYEPKENKQKESAQYAIRTSLLAILKLMAPFTPFITEELYHKYFHATEGEKSLHLTSWPEKPKVNTKSEAIGEVVVAILGAVRKKKTEAKLSMKAPVQKLVIETKTEITTALADLQATTCAQEITFGTAKEEITPELKITVEF